MSCDHTMAAIVVSLFIVMSLCCIFVQNNALQNKRYTPDWKSIDSRPLPNWYDESKIGIIIHWGVFSVPSFGSEWFWYYWKTHPKSSLAKYMNANYKPDFTYQDFAEEFTVQSEIYNPDAWADIFNASGAKYVVQVTKHHEGFTSWPSKYSFNWNAMDVGPHRDLVDDIAKAVRKYPNLRYGVYHSLFEWFNPLWLNDKKNNFTSQDFVRRKTMPELYELVNQYKPDVIWSDGCLAPSAYWNSTHFLAWLYNDSPVKDTVVTNDRWGSDTVCKHGGYYTCHDRYNPGKLLNHKFENAMTLDRKSWGFRRTTQLADVIPIEELIKSLVTTISCNGNLLVNVGPTKDGAITPVYEERLRQMGSWLRVNGEAIYKSRPWSHQNDTINPSVWYTTKGKGPTKVVYALVLEWPEESLALGAPLIDSQTTVSLLGYSQGPFNIDYNPKKPGLIIKIPAISYNKMPCLWAWVFKLTNVEN